MKSPNPAHRNRPSLLSFLLLLVLTARAGFSAEWYVAPGATSAGDGTIGNPWPLQTALNHPITVKPGDTVWLRGGTYVGSYRSLLKGTAAAPIIVRQYPGERATLDGQGQYGTQTAMFFVRGGYVWFWGFEVMSSNTDRRATAITSWPSASDLPRANGVEIDQNSGSIAGVKFINMIVRDTRQGLSLWSNSSDVEVYGCLVYYNGWDAPDRGHGHGIYVQNRTGRKWIRNCIAFGNYGDGMQAYGSEVSYLNNITVERSAFFDNGLPSGEYTDQLMLGGGATTRDDVISDNAIYAKSGTLFRLGYGAPSANAVVTSNYFAGAQGGIYFTSPSAMTLRGNRFYTPNLVGLAKTAYPDNIYAAGDPTVNSTFVHRNAYEPNRSHIVVYNWQNLSTVTVDVSQMLAPNDRYELRNAMNYFGDVLVGTNTTAGLLAIPMAGRVIAAPVGQAAPASPFPRFGAFLLLNLGPAGEGQANQAPSISPLEDRTISVGGSTGALPFRVSDDSTPPELLQVSASSSNPSLVPASAIALGGSGANRTITVTPAAGQAGSATLAIQVSDGALFGSISFKLTVVAPNTAPSISAIASVALSANSSTAPLSFTISDAQTPAGNLVLSKATSDPTLIPLAGITFGGSGNNRSVSIAPATGKSGFATVTVSVSDGLLSSSSSFDVTVLPPNTPPTISFIPDVQIPLGSSSAPMPFFVGDAQTPATDLLVTAFADDSSLLPAGSIALLGTGSARTATLTPAAGKSGSTRVTIRVSDGALFSEASFAVTVIPVNAAPTLSDLASLILPLGTAARVVNFQVADAETSASLLTVTVVSSNPLLLPPANLQLGGEGTDRWLSIAPAPLVKGTSTLTLSVSDGTTITSKEFVVSVSDANTPPTISAIAPVTVPAGSTSSPIPFSVRDDGTPAAELTLEATSSSRALLPTQNIRFGGTGEQRNLTVTPAPGQSGTAIVFVTVGDGTYRTRTSFELTVVEPNLAPTISSLGDLQISAGSSSELLSILIQDDRTPPESLSLQVASSDSSVIPASGLVLAGTGNFRILQIVTTPGAAGESRITLEVSDGSLRAVTEFTVVVVPSNTSPTITAPAGLEILVNTVSPVLDFLVEDLEIDAGQLLVSASSSNPGLIPSTGLVLGGSGGNRTLQISPATNQVGSATITLQVSDGSLTTSASFAVEVVTAGTPPWILPLQPVEVHAGLASPAFPLTVGDAESSASSLVLSASTSSRQMIPTQNVIFGGTDSNRTVSVTPLAGVSGLVTVFITVSDGVLRSRTRFDVTIVAPNAPPTLSSIPDLVVAPGSAPSVVPVTIGDLESDPDTLVLSGTSSNPSLVDASGLTLGGSGSARTLTIAPATGVVGVSTLQLTVSDGTNSASTSFQFTISSENLPPTMVLTPPGLLGNASPSAPIPLTVSDPDTPAEALTLLASTTPRTLLPTKNLVFEGSGSNRWLTIHPLPGLTGTVTVFVTVSDGYNRVRKSFALTLVNAE